MAALRQLLSYHRSEANATLRRTSLAGLPAARADVGAGASRGIRIAAFLAHDDQIAVIYQFYLNTDAVHATQDGAVFRQLVRGFAPRPLP